MYVCVYVCMHMWHQWGCVCEYMYVCMHAFTFVCVDVCHHVCMCLYVSVCVLPTHIHLGLRSVHIRAMPNKRQGAREKVLAKRRAGKFV